MAKVKIQGHASGTGVITVTAPNTSTDRTITLPDSTGTLIADNGSGKVGIGTSSPDGTAHIHTASAGSVTANADADDLVVENSGHTGINILSPDASRSAIQLGHTSDNLKMQIRHDGSTSLTQIISDDAITFNVTDGSESIRVTSDGITFQGDTASANALDDYEEGTCNMRFKADGSSTLVGSSSATYVKIGKMVTVQADMSGTLSSLTQNANMNLDGLPFTPNGAGSGTIFTRYLETPSDTTNVVGYYNSLAASIEVWFMPNHANYVRAKVQDFHNTNNDIYFTITYFTNS